MTEIEKHVEEIKSWTPTLLNMGARCTAVTMAAQEAALTALRRTAELCKAESEGLLVALPCKVGTPIWWIDVSIEPNERGKWVTRNRIKAMKFDHSVLDWIDTPFYLTRAEAEATLKEQNG